MSQNVFRYDILYKLLDFLWEETTSDIFPTFDDDWDMKTWTAVIFVYSAQKFFEPIHFMKNKYSIQLYSFVKERG